MDNRFSYTIAGRGAKKMAPWLIAPPNGLPLSCAALIDQESGRDETSCQNRTDLARRVRRQLQRLVGTRLSGAARGANATAVLNSAISFKQAKPRLPLLRKSVRKR